MSEQPTHIGDVIPVEFNPEKLRETLDRPFPPESIKTRRGSFGAELSYVEAVHYIRRLNESFGVAWSFQVIEHEVLDDEVLVLGKLVTHGHVRMAFGGSQITRAKESGQAISIADDLKAAATDAFKKSCSFLGVGLHLYGHAKSGVGTRTENSKGNGDNHSNANGNGHSRLTSRQHSYIKSLAGEKGIGDSDLEKMSLEKFGKKLSFVSKNDASSLIDQLQNP
jgi:hypothetical protein